MNLCDYNHYMCLAFMQLIMYDISCLRGALYYSKVTDPDPGNLFGSRSGLNIQIENTPKIVIFFSISIDLISLTLILTIPSVGSGRDHD